jgi:hypothetical protein
MNPEEQSYFRFSLAIAIILIVVVSFATIMRKPQTTKPVEKSSFEKVAEYEDCAIIRWTDQSNRWIFFNKNAMILK